MNCLVLNKGINPLDAKSDQHQFFSHQHQQIIKSKAYEIYQIDYQRENALILNQILSTILKRNVWRSVWRICMWILGLKGLSYVTTTCTLHSLQSPPSNNGCLAQTLWSPQAKQIPKKNKWNKWDDNQSPSIGQGEFAETLNWFFMTLIHIKTVSGNRVSPTLSRCRSRVH